MSYVIADDHRNKAPSWRYYFDYVTQQKRPDFPNGARHGDEVSYVLDTGAISPPTDEYFTEEDEAERMPLTGAGPAFRVPEYSEWS
jgi:para-nitrobenzyl esterase